MSKAWLRSISTSTRLHGLGSVETSLDVVNNVQESGGGVAPLMEAVLLRRHSRI